MNAQDKAKELVEKYKNIEVTVKGCDDSNPCIISSKMFHNSAKQCEKIADDFAIGFAEWVDEISFSPLDSVDYHLYQSHTITELLQIYKKEKGL